ncbi:hypothetical protein P154DRAFT_577229 [Amniculicola lignicola CBS 123094]|uniref:Uncharacterized protein n=1 Tax=Amniculicola lignicola CBS 123094 TaxID=1392246 RepID=A0A6A5WIW7_9PLEO|nr:hypothetical protein P154DRAFT_577229 [Amniculicola lignicola CBS 123094]
METESAENIQKPVMELDEEAFPEKTPWLLITRVPQSEQSPKGRLLLRFRPRDPLTFHHNFVIRIASPTTVASTHLTTINTLKEKLVMSKKSAASEIAAKDKDIWGSQQVVARRNAQIETLRAQVNKFESVQRESGEALSVQVAENRPLRDQLAESEAGRLGVVSVDVLMSDDDDVEGET